jgi:hypothetical protein
LRFLQRVGPLLSFLFDFDFQLSVLVFRVSNYDFHSRTSLFPVIPSKATRPFLLHPERSEGRAAFPRAGSRRQGPSSISSLATPPAPEARHTLAQGVSLGSTTPNNLKHRRCATFPLKLTPASKRFHHSRHAAQRFRPSHQLSRN